MKIKIKIGDRISKHFDSRHYKIYEDQNLPKPQTNREYFVYSSCGWVQLIYHNGLFYEFDNSINKYWLFYYTSTDSDIIKGAVLKGVPLKYLNVDGKKLSLAYNQWCKDRATYRSSLHWRYKILGR